MAKKRLKFHNKQGQDEAFDISVENVTLDNEGKTLGTKLAELEHDIEESGDGTYSKPPGGIPASDLAGDIPKDKLSQSVQASLSKADTALQQETDPTVPAWAKASNPPAQVRSDWNQTNPNVASFIVNKPELAPVATSGDYNDLRNKPAIPEGADLSGLFANVSYNSTLKQISFLDKGNNVVGTLDASPFVRDGMVSGVSLTNGVLTITFNTDSGKTPIEVTLGDLFNTDNYYTKTDADGKFVVIVPGKGLSTNDYTDADQAKLQALPTADGLTQQFSSKANASEVVKSISVNGQSQSKDSSGNVDIQVSAPNMGNYYTKDEVDDAIDEKLTEVTVNAVGNSASMYFAGSALCISAANLIQVTATPTITYVDNEQNVVVSVSGSGTLKAYLDGVEQTLVNGSFTIAKTSVAQSVVVTATAKEEGKAISAEASVTIVVGSYVNISNLLIGYSTNETPFDVFIHTTNMNSAGKVSVDTTDTKTFGSTTCYKFTVDLTDYIESESATSLVNQYNTSIFGVGTSGAISSVREISHIPSYFTKIGGQCFFRSSTQTAGTSSGLTHVVIPSSITQFENQAFKNCHALDAITFEGSTPPTLSTVNSSNSPFSGIQNKTITFNVPTGTVQTYAAVSSYQTNVNWLTGVSIQITDGTETATITKQS